MTKKAFNLLFSKRHKSKIVSSKLTVDEISEMWLASVKTNRKESTYSKYKYVYEHHIQPNIGTRPLCDISQSDINTIITEELSNSTCKSILCVINSIIAYYNRQFDMNISNLKYTNQKTRNKPIKILNHTEQCKLLKTLSTGTNKYQIGIYICLSTGLRLGEVCALKWSDIDLEQGLLHVNRSVSRIPIEEGSTKTKLIEQSPKTECSKREIPLSNQLCSLLNNQKRKGEYVLKGTGPTDPRTLQYKFKDILTKAGIDDTNFHVLRHTFATNSISCDTDVKTVSEILGHSDVQVTLNRYVHPSMEVKRAHMNTLANVYQNMLD